MEVEKVGLRRGHEHDDCKRHAYWRHFWFTGKLYVFGRDTIMFLYRDCGAILYVHWMYAVYQGYMQNPLPTNAKNVSRLCNVSGLGLPATAFTASLLASGSFSHFNQSYQSLTTDHEARGYISNTINTAFSCRSITSDTFSNRNGDLLYFRGSGLPPPPLLLSAI